MAGRLDGEYADRMRATTKRTPLKARVGVESFHDRHRQIRSQSMDPKSVSLVPPF